MNRHSPRRSFSLIDAMVTLVIVGISLALALPAIQAAREQARAGSCSDNLKDIALELQNDHIMLPPSTGAGSETTPLSPDHQQVAPGAGRALGLLLLINLFTGAAPHRLP